MTVADRIRNRREELKMSQEELASRIGLKDKSSISKIETSGDKVSLKNIEKIAPALSCSIQFLMGWGETYTKISVGSDEKTDTEDVQKKGIIRYIKTLIAAEKKNKANRKQLEEILKMAEELYGVDEETGEMVTLFHNATPEMQKAALAVLKAGQQPTEQTE